MRFCTVCGTPLSGTRAYCTHCGTAIRRTPHPELEAAQVGVAQATAPAPAAAGPSTPGPSTPGPSTPGPSTPGPSTAEPSTAEPSTPGPPSISLPTTWLADFDQRPERPVRSEPGPLPDAPPASGRTLLAVAVVAVLIAAGSAAWMAGSSRPRAGRLPLAATGVSPGRSARHPASRSASPRPSTPTVTPIPTSRRGIVSVSRALARRADAQQVAGFLDSYFAAVNHREYLEYSSLFERWHHLSREQFGRGYRSTHDSSAVLVGLSSSETALTATVTFTSHQAPSASPNHASCTNWRIVLYLRRIGGVYLIGPPPTGYHASYHGCG